MTSQMHDSAVKRLKMIDSHIKDSAGKYNFDFELVKETLKATRNSMFFRVMEVANRVRKYGPESHMVDKKEARLLCNKFTQDIVHTLIKEKHITREEIVMDIDTWIRSLMGTGLIDAGACTKHCVHYSLYMKCIKNLGTEKHYDFLLRATDFTDWGCFGLTELGRGSNIQSCETTATYDHKTKEFVLNSPTETSIKFWIGNLGKTANMMVAFAQLYVDEVCYGLHAFVVPIRDKTTHLPFPGCVIGDCGDKIGLQAMDNGWIEFQNYRIPVDNMLDKISQINEEGKFVTSIAKDGKRFAIQIGTMIGGRVVASSNAIDTCFHSLCTAIGYSSIRKQFSRSKNGPEISILEYPLQQSRLFPIFSKSFMTHIAVNSLWSELVSNSSQLTNPNSKSVSFLHLLTSAIKPVSTWLSVDAVKAARTACGGLGFTAHSNFHQFQQVSDVNQTWEGENYVIIQQACKIILKCYTDLLRGKDPIKTLEFMEVSSPDEIRFNGSFSSLNDILSLLTFKTNKLINDSIMRIQLETTKDEKVRLNQAEIWEKHLNYSLIPMVKAYVDRHILTVYIDWLKTFDSSPKEKQLFTKLALIGLQNQLIDDAICYRNVLDEEHIETLRESCIQLNKELKNDITGLALAIPINHSALGVISKGDNMYGDLMGCIKKTPGCHDRVEEWKYLYQKN